MADLRGALAGRLQYFAGHSDTLGLFADGDFLRRAAAGVADPFREADVHSAPVVDDWAETGSKALTARPPIQACGGVYAGLSLLVDQLPDAVRDELEPVAAVAFAAEVGG